MRLDSPHTAIHLRQFAGAIMCAVGFVSYAVSPDAAGQDNAKSVAAPSSISASSTAVKPASITKPEWQELGSSTQTALKPLQPNWPSMTPAHKRKWIELSKNYAALSPSEQTKLHTRMSEWATLSPQQRAAARLNFAENRAMTDGLTAEQRKVQWEAYQLLSPEEKSKLAASSQKPALGAATAVKPTQPIRQSPPPQYGTAKALAAASASNPQGRKFTIAPQLQSSNSIVPQSVSPQPITADAGSKP